MDGQGVDAGGRVFAYLNGAFWFDPGVGCDTWGFIVTGSNDKTAKVWTREEVFADLNGAFWYDLGVGCDT